MENKQLNFPHNLEIDTSKKVDHLNFLVGIRGGAALWVLLAHCQIWGGYDFHLIPDAKIAVDIFMVMSGYLMSYNFMARNKQEPFYSLKTAQIFWLRRFFRIAPLYYLLLIIVFIFIGPLVREGYTILRLANPDQWAGDIVYNPQNIKYTMTNFIAHITFFFGIIPKYVRGTLMPDWSMGLEMQFYAVFPLLFILFRRWGYTISIILAIMIRIISINLTNHLPPVLPGTHIVFIEPSFLPFKLPLFLIGMLAAETHKSFSLSTAKRAYAIALAILLASMNSIFVIITAVAIILFSIFNKEEAKGLSYLVAFLNRVLGNRCASFMSDTSYSVYLIHGLFISIIGGFLFEHPQFLHLSAPARVLFLMCLTVVCAYSTAWALHICIENPGINLGRKIIKKYFTITTACKNRDELCCAVIESPSK